MKGIYLIENIKLNEKYIGSSYKIHSRWGNHIRQLIKNEHHSKLLQNSFNLSNLSDFRFSILEIVRNDISDKDLEQKESDWSKNFNDYINRLPLSKDGKVNFHHSRKTIINILKSQNRYKPFYAIDLNDKIIGEYELLEDARKDLKISVSSIRLSLISHIFTRKSIGFIYKNDYGKYSLVKKKVWNFGLKQNNQKRIRMKVKVYTLYGDYFNTFDSIHSCAEYFKASPSNIFKTLNLFPKKILYKSEVSKYLFIKDDSADRSELINSWKKKYDIIKINILVPNGNILIKDLYDNIIGKTNIEKVSQVLKITIPSVKEVIKGRRIQTCGFKLIEI